MSALVLRARSFPAQRVDLAPLVPDALRGKSAGEIARMTLACGNRRIEAGELFDVSGGGGDLVIEGANGRLDFIGAGLAEGTITVEGDAGAYAGLGMRGGKLRVSGDAGPWAGAEMRGGALEIGGAAGDHLGGALPGRMRGMNGGLVTVRGAAGARAGERMRRGLIVIEGDAGDYAGSRMIAGTILLLGGVGACPGFAMQRGTLLMRRLPPRTLPTFVDAGANDILFLRFIARSLPAGSPAERAVSSLGTRVRRYVGDGAVAGRGEILVWSEGELT